MEALGYLVIRWVFAVFATYRVARMLALEEGPFGAFALPPTHTRSGHGHFSPPF